MKSVAGLFLLGSSASAGLLTTRGAKKDTDDVDERRRDVQKKYEEGASMMKEGEQIHEELRKLGAADMLKGSPEAEKNKLAEEYRGIRDEAEKKGHHLTHEEAFKMISERLSPEEKNALNLVLRQDSTKLGKAEDEKAMYVKAMQALNDMFLSVDDERIKTVTTCNVELTAMWKKVFTFWQTIGGLSNAQNQAWANARMSYAAADKEFENLQRHMEMVGETEQGHAIAMQGEQEELKDKEAEVTLFRFIMAQVDKQCGGAEEEPAFMQMQRDRTDAQEKCVAKASMNDALVKVFADPAILKQAEKELDSHVYHRLHHMLGGMREAANEKVHPKYAFLQKTPTGSEAPPSICDYSEGMDCDALRTVVGQELECRKQEFREAEAEVEALTESQREEKDDMNDQTDSIKMAENQFHVSTELSIDEAKDYKPPKDTNWRLLLDTWHDQRERRFQCYLKLFELDSNHYCAVKKLREYMKEQTLEKFGLADEDVRDCEPAEFMSPTGECQDKDEKVQHCVTEEELPTDPAKMAYRTWTRQQFQPPEQTSKATEALGGSSISLSCPHTMQMDQVCNNYKCPQDCVVSEWSEWSQCPVECDGSSQQRARQVIFPQAYGGNACPPLQETQPCNTEACDKDCVLHEDWVAESGCLSACGPERKQLFQRHIKDEAKGKGECPEKHSMERAEIHSCPERECHGDEICYDMMDLVLAYECSATVTKLGCWFMAAFVVNLVDRMPSVMHGAETLKIALVKFGNGASVPYKDAESGETRYTIAPPVVLTKNGNGKEGFTGNVSGLRQLLYQDVYKLWTSQAAGSYKLGFNNMATMLKRAGDLLNSSPRMDQDGLMRKVLVLTKGKRASCTAVKEVSEPMKTDGIHIDMLLFSNTYSGFETLQDSVSYPYQEHLHLVGGLVKLFDYGNRQNLMRSTIPYICPNAISPEVFKQSSKDGLYAIVHRGRTCPSWELKLTDENGDESLTLEKCRHAASKGGYLGFLYTELDEGETGSNCLTHAKLGKEAQVDASGKALEKTCDHKPKYQEQNKNFKAGWMSQELPEGSTSHYRVLQSTNEVSTIVPKVYAQYKIDFKAYIA